MKRTVTQIYQSELRNSQKQLVEIFVFVFDERRSKTLRMVITFANSGANPICLQVLGLVQYLHVVSHYHRVRKENARVLTKVRAL